MLQPNLNVPTEQLQHFRDPGCSIGSSRRKSRLWRRRNYHARGLIVTEEVPCRGPSKRATHFAKCLVHVGTILAHLAATYLSTATSSATLVSTASPRGRRKKLPSTYLLSGTLTLDTSRHSAPQDELEAREPCSWSCGGNLTSHPPAVLNKCEVGGQIFPRRRSPSRC